jgi:hypothetical protein
LRLQIADLQVRAKEVAMLGELTNIPTDTLIGMLYMILPGEVAITVIDAAEIEQIQREPQRRGGAQIWSFAPLTERRAGITMNIQPCEETGMDWGVFGSQHVRITTFAGHFKLSR